MTRVLASGWLNSQSKYSKILNSSLVPNPDGQINRKPDGRIFDQTAELIKNRTAEFDRPDSAVWVSPHNLPPLLLQYTDAFFVQDKFIALSSS